MWFLHGNVYVVDTLNDRVQVFTSSGQFINTISNYPHTSMLPTGIAIDSMNTVYISNGSTVSVFDNRRQFIKCLEVKFNPRLSFFRRWSFQGLAVDYTGNLLHALPRQGAVAIYWPVLLIILCYILDINCWVFLPDITIIVHWSHDSYVTRQYMYI